MNETKLANFPEIKAFIAISCPFSSFINNREFYIVF